MERRRSAEASSAAAASLQEQDGAIKELQDKLKSSRVRQAPVLPGNLR